MLRFTVLDTFFYAALRKTLELTKPFSYRVNNTSLRVGFEKNRIEKFLMGRHILCFYSLVLDTFFCATLRKTLELTKLFSYRANKTSLRVGFEENRIEKFFDWKTTFVLRFTSSRYIFLRCAKKNTRTDGATDMDKLIRSINYFPKFFFARLGRSSYRPSINANFFA